MRPKYRVWDKKRKKYLTPEYGDQLILRPDGSVWWASNEIEVENISDKVEIEFFTGLHDKNGKEVYEGDIIQDVYDHNYERWIVMWWPEMAQFVLGNGSLDVEKVAKEELIIKKNDKIIGDVHTTPELMEKQ